jgi:hypothetical protein
MNFMQVQVEMIHMLATRVLHRMTNGDARYGGTSPFT